MPLAESQRDIAAHRQPHHVGLLGAECGDHRGDVVLQRLGADHVLTDQRCVGVEQG